MKGRKTDNAHSLVGFLIVSLGILTTLVHSKTDSDDGILYQQKNETSVSPNSSSGYSPLGHPRDNTGQSEAFGSPGDHAVYPPNIYAPQAQAFYYRFLILDILGKLIKGPFYSCCQSGYDNASGEWDEYPPYINAEGLEIGSLVSTMIIPLLYFMLDMDIVRKCPMDLILQSPLLSSVGGDAHLYSPQQFPFSGPPYYQHLGPPNMSYITSPSPISQPEFNTLANIDQQGDNMLFGPRPSYPPVGSISGGSFPGKHGFHDMQHGFDGLRSGGLWSAWSKPSDRNRPCPPFHLQFLHSLLACLGHLGRMLECLDILSEQNRGPRASKSKAQNTVDHGPSVEDKKHSKPSAKIHDESYNQSDFVTEYKDAKFFIIKSYSEDNVHKSIKYGVWASTPNGNRKLDTAYHEAKDKQDPCPVFSYSRALVGESEHRNAVTLPTDIIKQMSKSFAQVICLDESSKEGIVTDRASSGTDGSVGTRVKLEDGIATVSPSQTMFLCFPGPNVAVWVRIAIMCSVADDKELAAYFVFKQSKITLEPRLVVSEIVSVADLKFLIENLDEKLNENEKWENVTNKRNNLLAYTAKCFKPKDAPIKYLSLTVFENCTMEVLRDFYMDNEYRKQWDKTVVEHEQLQVDRTNGTEIGCTIKKFPLLTPREYVLAWRLWEGKDKTFYCFIKECEYPLAVRQRRFVRVKFFRSGWRISKVPGRNACQIKMFHQEDAGLNLEMAKLAFSRGIWSYVCKMNDALRKYSLMSHPCTGPAVTAVTLIQKVPPELETMNTVVDTQATSTLIASQGLDTGEAKEKKFLRRPSKKIVANGLLLLGGVIFLSRGHSSLGAKVAMAYILTKLRKHDASSGQERER
ncbi:hypothetical protein POTOM_045982 [Populus tomentosa]|uniref:START domain-containing protein n=1 Tax=Populus tomentosa TaxID=118781 RepID=A0A8X8CDJ4_POPTO|nr:hypothetical protein POTOM_045982 [Populus tomentosa]